MRTAAPLTKVAVTRKEAAAMYGVSVWTIDELVASGQVTAKRLGARRVLIDAASLRRWFDSLDEA